MTVIINNMKASFMRSICPTVELPVVEDPYKGTIIEL